jgi:hypothetical protein
LYEFLQDRIHDLIAESGLAVLDELRLRHEELRPGTEHTVSLMLKASPIRVQLVVSFIEEKKPIGIPFMTEDAVGPEYRYED